MVMTAQMTWHTSVPHPEHSLRFQVPNLHCCRTASCVASVIVCYAWSSTTDQAPSAPLWLASDISVYLGPCRCLQAGSSLALAVLNCAVPWPKTPDWSYPSQLHDLVLQCLAQDPAARPTAAQLCHTAQELAAAGLPDPPALAKEQEADAGHVAVNMQ
jgi:hypothetical protein